MTELDARALAHVAMDDDDRVLCAAEWHGDEFVGEHSRLCDNITRAIESASILG